MNNEIQEIRYQVGEAWKGTYNAATTYGNANVVQDPTGLSVYRSLKPGNVGHPLTDTNWWSCIIDLSSIKAESDRIAALNTAIAQDEQLRVAAEQLRQQKEAQREAAETQRNDAEQARVSAEQQRVSAEQQRASQEQTRISQEQSRVTAEQGRVAAEAQRVQKEQLRENNEAQRVINETNRVAAEAERVAQYAADHQQAVSDHNQAVQDHETLAPTVAEHTQQIAGLGTSKQDVITNLATIAMGSGVSHDDTYSNTRTSTIANFILLTNATVDILFTTPINAANATLNVSQTGAKPLHILGQALPAGVIKAQTYAQLVYDGTAWNIVNLFRPDASFDPAALVVDMGLPSGVKWASRDIDLTKPGGFCETPFVYEKSFFSWGNIDGHNPSSVSDFDYDWGGINQADPPYEGQVYGSTPGNTLTGNIAVGEDFDAARANLGAPWRMPTSAEYAELFANIKYINADGTEVDTTKADKRVTVNGILGLYIQSNINGARLFFSCSGYGGGRSWFYRGSYGYYWSSTWYSARNARDLRFYSGGVNPQNYYYRYFGFALRPVQ
jgi:hypothetical protein